MKKADLAMQQWQKETRMKKLILAAMDKMDAEDLLELMYEKCCDATQREYLKDKMIDLALFDGGGILIKTSELGLNGKDKLIDFVSSEIYPSYNEQETNILFYS